MTKNGKKPQIINSSKTHTHGTGAEKNISGFRSAKRQVEQGLGSNKHLDVPTSLGGNADTYGRGGIDLTTTPINDRMAPEPKDWNASDIDHYWNSTYKKNTDKQYQDMLDFDSEQDRITEEQNLDSIPGLSRGTDTFFNQMWDTALGNGYPYNALAQRWLSGNLDAALPYGPSDFNGFEYSYMWENPNLDSGKDRFGTKYADGATVTNTPIIGSPLMETNLDKTRPGWRPGMGNTTVKNTPVPSNAEDIYNAQQAAKGITSALGGILAHAGQTGRGGIPINAIQEKTMSQDDYQDAKGRTNNASQNSAGYISMPSLNNMSPEDKSRYEATLANSNAAKAASEEKKNNIDFNWGDSESDKSINFDWDGDGSPDLDNTSNIGKMIQLSKPSSGSDTNQYLGSNIDNAADNLSPEELELFGGADAYNMANKRYQGANAVIDYLTMPGRHINGMMDLNPSSLAGTYAWAGRNSDAAKELAQAQTKVNRQKASDLQNERYYALRGRNLADDLFGREPENVPSQEEIDQLRQKRTREDVINDVAAYLRGDNGAANPDQETEAGSLESAVQDAAYNNEYTGRPTDFDYNAELLKYATGLGYKDIDDFKFNGSEAEWQALVNNSDFAPWYTDIDDVWGGWDPYWAHYRGGETYSPEEYLNQGKYRLAGYGLTPQEQVALINSMYDNDSIDFVPNVADINTLRQIAGIYGIDASSLADGSGFFELMDLAASNPQLAQDIEKIGRTILQANIDRNYTNDISDTLDFDTYQKMRQA